MIYKSYNETLWLAESLVKTFKTTWILLVTIVMHQVINLEVYPSLHTHYDVNWYVSRANSLIMCLETVLHLGSSQFRVLM